MPYAAGIVALAIAAERDLDMRASKEKITTNKCTNAGYLFGNHTSGRLHI